MIFQFYFFVFTFYDVIISTYSASGNQSCKRMDIFVGDHPDINSTLFIADGSIDRDYIGQNLIEQQTPIIVLSAVEGGY